MGRDGFINWSLLMLLLRKHYKSPWGVSRELGLDGAHLSRLSRGEVAEPRFNSGVKLLDLAFDKVPIEELRRTRGS